MNPKEKEAKVFVNKSGEVTFLADGEVIAMSCRQCGSVKVIRNMTKNKNTRYGYEYFCNPCNRRRSAIIQN